MHRQSRSSLFAAVVMFFVLQATLISSSQWPYLQIYPPVNESDVRTPLYFALVLSRGGNYKSIGALPGVQIALDYINNQSSLLHGYSLHYTLTDSQCKRSNALDSYFYQLRSNLTKVGWIGSGCSPATEPTAELTQYYNITQISCVSSSPNLQNRQRFRYYFQLLSTDVLLAQGFYGIIENFGWRKVRLIAQNENLFTATMDALKQNLTESGVEFSEIRFTTDDGIEGINIFDSDIRIYVLAMYSVHARDVMCAAYRRDFRYPKYMFITYGWYVDKWWEGPPTIREYDCSAEERASLLPYTLAPLAPEFPDGMDTRAEPNITESQFNPLHYDAVDRDINQNLNLTDNMFPYTYVCYEAMIAFAYALNHTIEDLRENSTLNMEAARLSDLPEGQNFTMADFTYANSAVVSRMFTHLQNTSFPGFSGNDIRFNDQGVRDIGSVTVLQYQPGELSLIRVATVTDDGYMPVRSSIFPDGTPSDGIPIEKVVTVSVALTVVYVILAVAGIIFTAICLVFITYFRQKKLIRLSSPNLNYIIGLGAIVLYLNVITFVIPTTNPDVVSVLCNIQPWLTSLGYSLCYGTILIKMIRVWVIFSKPLGLNIPLFKDYFMALIVLCLVVIDVAILGIYTLIEGLKGNLGVKLIMNRELPRETIGPTAVIHEYFLYVCESDGQDVLYAVLYGYKGLLQAIALLLAFRTRKVKVKGLDDSKYIAASIYVTSIVLAVIIVSTYTLMDYVNVYPAVVGMGLLLGTTMILALVFVPRMFGLYKDPDGDTITTFISVHKEESVTNNMKNDKELSKLRRRVFELENILKQQTPLALPESPSPTQLEDVQAANEFPAIRVNDSSQGNVKESSSNGKERV